MAADLRTGFRVSAPRACDVVHLNRSTLTYRQHAPDQTLLRMRLRDLAAARMRYGYRRLHVVLRREGWHINHKRIYRLYRLEGLNLRLKRPRKRVSQIRVMPPAATAPNECWSMDFMSAQGYDRTAAVPRGWQASISSRRACRGQASRVYSSDWELLTLT